MNKSILGLLAMVMLAGCGAPATTPKTAQKTTFTAQARTVELQNAVRRMFELSIAFADKDGDKRLSFDEAQIWAMPQATFTARDTNADGGLSVTELATTAVIDRYVKHLNDVAEAAVLALDVDGDQKMTIEEMSNPILTVSPGPWQINPSTTILPDAFSVADRSLDGKLTAAEAEGFFAHLVANGYGYRLVHSDPMSQVSQR